MTTPQNPNESAVQIGKIAISIIPTIRTYSYIFVPIRNSRFSSDSHLFVLLRVTMGEKPWACATQKDQETACRNACQVY